MPQVLARNQPPNHQNRQILWGGVKLHIEIGITTLIRGKKIGAIRDIGVIGDIGFLLLLLLLLTLDVRPLSVVGCRSSVDGRRSTKKRIEASAF